MYDNDNFNMNNQNDVNQNNSSGNQEHAQMHSDNTQNNAQNYHSSYTPNPQTQRYYYGQSNQQTYQYGTQAAPQPQKPKTKKEKPFLKKAACFVGLGLLFGAAAGAAFSIPTYITNQQLLETKLELEELQSQSASAQISTTTGSLVTADSDSQIPSSDIQAIAKNCLPSVVSITNKGVTEVRTMFGTYQQDTESSGSGIIIGSNDQELLIVTNYHVVSGSNELSVVFSYDEDSEEPSVVSAKLKGYASDKDLAVISVSMKDITPEMKSQIKVATIGDSSHVQLGQQVVAIGNALGYGQSVTTGIVSALNREVTVEGDDGTPITNKLIQTDAAINPGNSGGALLNMNGELIGINSVKVSSSSVEGMGYAIPISDVQSIIEELMLKETRDVVDADARGYLGITGVDVTNDISETYGMPIGIFINTIYDDSPAKAAGLAEGNIITKFDGQTVKTMSELQTLLTYYKSGETVDIIAKVQGSDGYTEQTFSLTLGSKDIFGEDAPDNEEQDSQETPYRAEPYPDYGYEYQNPFNFLWPFGY